MIFQYVYLDYGAQNQLNILKYSALNLRAAINKDDDQHQIQLHLVRSLGRNTAHDLAGLKMGGVFDAVEVSPFGKLVNIEPGWYQRCHLPYLDIASKSEHPICYVNQNMLMHSVPDIDTNHFYFWTDDNKWFDVPWGMLTQEDAEDFIQYCQSNGLLSDADILGKYTMYNPNFVHIPKEHVHEIKEKYTQMIEWILSRYKDEYARLNCACSCAGQICISLLSRDMCKSDQDIVLADNGFGPGVCTRFDSAAESDISGSLRIFFE